MTLLIKEGVTQTWARIGKELARKPHSCQQFLFLLGKQIKIQTSTRGSMRQLSTEVLGRQSSQHL